MIGVVSPLSWPNFIHNSIRNSFQALLSRLKFKMDALKLSAQSLVGILDMVAMATDLSS